MNAEPSAYYRKDIDGLRALAVLFVVIFHINENLIPGGFVGVDIFFVISGFVITQRILKDLAGGTFSYIEFYRRRIRRILPVMFFVTSVTLVAGTLILLPDDLTSLSWSTLFSAFSAANIYFTYFLDTSYFASDSRLTPLLHLWSLGVEEQFYFIWPALLLALVKWPRSIIPGLVLLIVASIGIGQILLAHGEFSFAYYMLPSRMFQLAAGGAAVFVLQSTLINRLSHSMFLIIGLVGLSLVAGSAWLLDGNTAFPGLNAVPVTLGAFLIILSGSRKNLLADAFSITPARWIGNISYSLYLWHWPVLAFMRYSYIELDFLSATLAFVAMIVLSTISYFTIETPFRHSSDSFQKVFGRFFAIPAVILTAGCLVIIAFKGIIPLFSPANYATNLARLAEESKPANEYDYVCQRSQLRPQDLNDVRCVINGPAKPKILLWGDSNAAHYVGVLGALAKSKGVSFRNIEHSACPPLINDPSRFANDFFKRTCKISSEIVKPLLDKYDHIIIASSWAQYDNFSPDFQAQIKETLQSLSARGKKVTVLGQAVRFPGYDRRCRERALKLGTDCIAVSVITNPGTTIYNEKVKMIAESIPNVEYTDFNALLCNGKICSPYNGTTPLYFDTGHLSIPGSWLLGEMAVKTGQYSKLFEPH
ncbi:acyltransferase family protein [Phyllobacterium sp. YR531]|uniref:acyltransferase family protein n=1 Tax=Phyllobacterium sp. YR531 TaxID=1144343 RepID=UPI00026FAA14|nr:acyltransferase family protein [Phyllobacterium sp. YR531]EJN02272.1 putative acyltransferase [Phyllobacterium sp. YR531]